MNDYDWYTRFLILMLVVSIVATISSANKEEKECVRLTVGGDSARFLGIRQH